jgi:hypothetical protein
MENLRETINQMIRNSNFSPGFIGWIGALIVLALYDSWRGRK